MSEEEKKTAENSAVQDDSEKESQASETEKEAESTETEKAETKEEAQTSETENAEQSTETKPKMVTYKEKKEALKKDKQYKKGNRIYQVGMWLLTLYLLATSAKYFLKAELFINGTMISNYIYLIVVIPLVLMVIGLSISSKAAKKHGVDENNKIWITLLSIAAILTIVLSVCEILMPSYHIYSIKNYKGRESGGSSQKFIITEYAKGTIFNPAPSERPHVRYLDVYADYGFIAVRKASTRYGKYEITPQSGSNDYVLSVTTLGREEDIPFTY